MRQPLDDHDTGTCSACRRVFRVRPQDDGARIMRVHGPLADRCTGSGRPAVEYPPLNGEPHLDPDTPDNVVIGQFEGEYGDGQATAADPVRDDNTLYAILTPKTSPGRIQLIHQGVTMDLALDSAWHDLGLEPMGGASGHGWSRYRSLQLCPYLFYQKHVAPKEGDDVELSPPAGVLQIGAAFHAFNALYYFRIIQYNAGAPVPADPGRLCDLLLDYGADPEYVEAAWRIFEARVAHYESLGDVLVPLAVEHLAIAQDVTPYRRQDSCRYDLIARIESGGARYIPGVYIVELKSAFRLDRGNQEGWHLDGEIIGQLMLWERAGLAERFGPLQGVIVDVTVKTKTPKFHREIVSPPWQQMRRQMQDLDVWRTTEQLYRTTNTWPRSLASCWRRYGACELFDHCRDVPEPDEE